MLLLDEPLGALDLKLRKQMQLYLKRIQHEVGITFVHVTHDQEEAMTMADTIAVMNHGRIEQLGAAGGAVRDAADGVRRGLPRRLESPAGHRGGRRRRAPRQRRRRASGDGREDGAVSAGVRPEKIALGEGGGANRLTGTVSETAYIGVATQVVVDTPDGTVQVFAQNIDSGSRVPAPGSPVTLSWSPESTFVVESVPMRRRSTHEPDMTRRSLFGEARREPRC